MSQSLFLKNLQSSTSDEIQYGSVPRMNKIRVNGSSITITKLSIDSAIDRSIFLTGNSLDMANEGLDDATLKDLVAEFEKHPCLSAFLDDPLFLGIPRKAQTADETGSNNASEESAEMVSEEMELDDGNARSHDA